MCTGNYVATNTRKSGTSQMTQQNRLSLKETHPEIGEREREGLHWCTHATYVTTNT